MTDLRNYLGKTAKTGQKIAFYYTFGSVGEGVLTEVSPVTVGVKGEIEIPKIIKKSDFHGSIQITGPKTCIVTVSSEVDPQASYQEGSHLQVECKLFGKDFRIDLWQDGLYSNIRVFLWAGFFWSLLVHAWTHPKPGEMLEGDIVSLTFNPELWPALPASGAAAL